MRRAMVATVVLLALLIGISAGASVRAGGPERSAADATAPAAIGRSHPVVGSSTAHRDGTRWQLLLLPGAALAAAALLVHLTDGVPLRRRLRLAPARQTRGPPLGSIA